VVDRDLVLKKLAFAETCVRDLRAMARLESIEQDVREERFVVHTLQLAIQAVLDAASHVVSDERLGEPQTNRELFDLLARCRRAPDACGAKRHSLRTARVTRSCPRYRRQSPAA
jgi:uncharacterized protein YutE (UPF0331/DUF86 family)